MAVLIQDAEVYAPEKLGKQDILIVNDKVARIGSLDAGRISECFPGLEVINGQGKIATPGFIDQHVHLIGGGGEMGFATRTPEVALSKIVEAGVTTVAGLLGTDGYARSIEALYAKAKGLETEGITAYMYTGAYQLPTVTITGSAARDIMFMDKVIGVKLALSDHRSSQVTYEEFIRLAAEARVAGMLSGKPGMVHIHMGAGKQGFGLLFRAAEESDIPITQFIPTHVTRSEELFVQAKEFAKRGGRIDITSFAELEPDGKMIPSKAIMECLRDGIPAKNITVSSDGNGSVPKQDEQGNLIGLGVGSLAASQTVFRRLVQEEGLDISTALPFFTSNVAGVLGVYPQKGCICTGGSADLLLYDTELNLDTVFAKGQKMLEDGMVIIKGMFED